MRVRIKDFQSIEDIDFEVSGLTCLVGPSDIGKSSIIRAVEGTFTNPPVKSEVRNGKDGLEVTLDLPELPQIIWTKLAKGSGTYSVSDTYYEKLGRDVPPEFKDFGLVPVELDSGAEIYTYVQGQHDSPFLDSEPKLLAEIISKFGSLSSINKAHVLVNRDIKADKKSVRLLAEKKNDLDAEIKSLEWVPGVRERFDAIVASLRLLEEKEKEVVEVEKNVRDLRELEKKLERLETLEEALQKVPDIEPIKRLSELAQEVSELARSLKFEERASSKLDKLLPVLEIDEDLVKELTTLGKEIKDLRLVEHDVRLLTGVQGDLENYLKILKIISSMPDIEVDGLIDTWGTIKEAGWLIETLRMKEEVQSTLDSELESIEGSILEVQKELEEVDICPLCGSSPEKLSETAHAH